jgi:hypothetical protein
MFLDVIRDKDVELVAPKASLKGYVQFVLVEKNLQKKNDWCKAGRQKGVSAW